jgi:hypothetical protein
MDEVIYSFNFNILNIFIILPQQTSWWWGTWQPESVWIVGPVRVLPLWTGENCKAVRIRRLLQHKPNYCPFPLEETDTLEWCWISILSPHSKREIKFHLVTIKEHKWYVFTYFAAWRKFFSVFTSHEIWPTTSVFKFYNSTRITNDLAHFL